MKEGEYESEDYNKATGLVLTFLVRNSLDEEELAPVLKWEQRYARVKREWKLKSKSVKNNY